MNCRPTLLFLALYYLSIHSIQAQRPIRVLAESTVTSGNNLRSQGCPGAEAGTFRITSNAANQSNNTRYLCFGDRLNIVHNRNGNFSGDPNPSTTPGTAYVYYDCKPTREATSLATLIADPCINKKTPIIVNGLPVNQRNGLWIAKGTANGDIEFVNDGFLQTTYNNGNPVQFWFAPVTLDRFSGDTVFEKNASDISGPCIDVNIDSAFSVVYLNELRLTNITGNNGGPANYTGTFTVGGGLPQYDTASNYTIVSIVNNADANIIGRLTNGPAKNGKPMQFSAPSPGRYTITIEDINGCTITGSVTIEEDPGILRVLCANGSIGSEVCYTINVGRIPDLTAAQFTFSFNPQLLEYTGARNLNPSLGTTIDAVVVTNDVTQGYIKFFWFDFNLTPRDFTTEVKLIDICFRVKGPPGNNTVRVLENPGPNLPSLELSNLAGTKIPLTTASGSVFACTSLINPATNLDAFYAQCGQALFGQVFAGRGPFTIEYGLIGNASIRDKLNIPAASVNTLIFANLPQGQYELITTDADSNKVRDTFNFSAAVSDIAIDLSNFNNESCVGNDGRITAMVSNGSLPFRFSWSNGSVTPTINRLVAGKYIVTVTDAQGCFKLDSINILRERPRSAISIARLPVCNGITDGRLSPDFASIQGIGPFSFEWLGNGTQIGNSYTNLGDSLSRLVITDSKGCKDTASLRLTYQKRIALSPVVDNPTCFARSDGRLEVGRMFSDGSTLVNDTVYIFDPLGVRLPGILARPARLNAISAGSYRILIRDQSGCFLDTLLNLTQPLLLDTASVVTRPESCVPGSDAAITINMTGGTGPYRYTWADAPINSNTRTGLISGNYQVTVTDANNCSTNFNAGLSFNFVRTVVPVSIDTTPILCFGQGADLTARAGAGFTIVRYKWSNGDSTATSRNNLANRPAIVEVTDNKGCKGQDTVILSQPLALALLDSQIIEPLCPRDSSGRINFTARGGTGPYTYTLNGGTSQNFGVFTRLRSGNYSVTITDANRCPSLILNAILREPPAIVAVFDSAAFRGVRCAGTGDCTGQARILVSGGTDPQNNFRIIWSSNEQTLGLVSSTADSLCAGLQTVRILDGNNCSTTATFNIVSPTAIIRDPIRTIAQDIVCAGQRNGSINYLAFGGTSPYRYVWNDADTNNVRSGIAAGKYTVTVTDLNNCSFIDSLFISEPSVLALSLDSIKVRPITCPGSNDGHLGVKTTGGNIGAIRYTWTPNFPDTNFIRNIRPGIYSVIATDSKGCSDTLANLDIAEPTWLSLDLLTSFIPRCAGDTIGIFINNATGGNGASYSYSINNGNSIPITNRIPLKAGSYQLTLFDRKGCALDTTITVVDPPRFNVDFGPDRAIRLGDSLRITAVGNNPISMVNWGNTGEFDCLNADCSLIRVRPFKNTIFTATAIDQSGCRATDQVMVTVDTRRAIYIPNAFRPDQLSANQDFRLFSGSGVVKIHYGRMFNRWGDIISEIKDLGPDPAGVLIWDGRFKGVTAPSGVYVYLIDVEFTDGVRLVYKGDVTLIN